MKHAWGGDYPYPGNSHVLHLTQSSSLTNTELDTASGQSKGQAVRPSLQGQSGREVRGAAPGRGPQPGGAPGPLGTDLSFLVCGRLRAGFGL